MMNSLNDAQTENHESLLVLTFNGASDTACANIGAGCGLPTASAATTDEAARSLRDRNVAVCLVSLDSEYGDLSAIRRLMTETVRHATATQFVVLTANAVSPEPEWAHQPHIDTWQKPITESQLTGIVHAALKKSRLKRECERLDLQLRSWIFRDLIGRGTAIEQLRQQLNTISARESNVLIRGETGAGLSTVAAALSALSPDVDQAVVHVDCRITSSETFQRDIASRFASDTGALRIFSDEAQGQMPESPNRVLILDHVEAASLSLQDRVLQLTARDRRHWRIIASTNTDLVRLMTQGQFRDELFHQLNCDVIDVPPLKERRCDIAPLAEHFLRRAANNGRGESPKRLSVDAVELLETHDWPDNLNELIEVLGRAASIEDCEVLTATEIAPWIEATRGDTPTYSHSATGNAATADGLSLRAMERKLIEATFSRFRGNREQTAKQLQIGLRTLSGKLREYGYPPRGGPGSNRSREQRRAA